MKRLKFFVMGLPATAGSKRHVGRGIIVDSSGAKGRAWRAMVVDEATKAFEDDKPWRRVPIRMTITFYLPRPQGHYGKKGLLPSAPEHHTKRPDATKLLRAIEDALTGIIWHDDSQIVHQHVHKLYTDATPGAGVFIEQCD